MLKKRKTQSENFRSRLKRNAETWANEKGIRMGILIVIHTFGADMKWHAHIHLIVTGGGLSLDRKRWIAADPKFLMHHGGLKKRWKYQVTTRMKRAHRKGQWHFLSEP